jgi:hypothetical protein
LPYIAIPETERYPDRRLGRHQAIPDMRDFDHLAEGSSQLVSGRHASVGLPLNQGNIGDCTANALCGALNSSPDNISGRVFTEGDAVNIYKRETADEGYPYPQFDPGGTLRAVCKAGRELGLISSWQNALGLQAALQALVLHPILIGIKWYASFDTPMANGQIGIANGASVRGGHALVLDELDVDHYMVGGWNSWGASWGPIGGRFLMSWHCFWRLLGEGGEVTVPIV